MLNILLWLPFHTHAHNLKKLAYLCDLPKNNSKLTALVNTALESYCDLHVAHTIRISDWSFESAGVDLKTE